MKKRFRFQKQLNAMDCGPSCIKMIARHYGRIINSEELRRLSGFSKTGVSLLGVSDAAEKIGFRTTGVKVTFDQLKTAQLPAIIHWNRNHFVVIISINRSTVKIADPAKSVLTLTYDEFQSHWISSTNENGEGMGIALLLEPTTQFYDLESDNSQRIRWTAITKYLKQQKWQVSQIIIALTVSSIIALLFPFLTQAIIDIGIGTHNLHFITIVLAAQLALVVSQSLIEFVQNRLLLRISNILNIQILSDFWIKLTKLPLSYFTTRQTGDTIQRIGDHTQIQQFLTGTALKTLFSVFNFVVYATVLVIYNINLFVVFCIGSSMYFVWIRFFLGVRRKINYEMFHLSAKENNATLQLIQGMQEIRLNNAEKQKRWEWENLKSNTYKLALKSLHYSQIQKSGATLINSIQGIVISFLVARLVIDGKLTLGSMLAIQYVVGQLSGPIQQWVGFVQSAQDAKISMERLNEVHQIENEERYDSGLVHRLPKMKSIHIENLSFSYPGVENEHVLSDINLEIEENKMTAIVGASGSGKTTLIKLLLRIYDNYEGNIRIGDKDSPSATLNLRSISHSFWRSNCGSVLQDGHIFSDNVARNIALGFDEIDYDHLVASTRFANIQEFVDSLPNGYHTKLGVEGAGISQGQKQRILIARAYYKSPSYLFFDEATNALDALNERTIIENMNAYTNGKTVVVVAHRLSTVKQADKIVVLHKGKLVEQGTHDELSALRGYYFDLVKNQLELTA